MKKICFLSTEVIGTQLEKYIINKEYEIVYINSENRVYPSIDSHCDIFMTSFTNDIIIEPYMHKIILRNYPKFKNLFKIGDSEIGYSYPQNIKYNGLVIGKYFIHNLKYTDKNVLKEVEKRGLVKLNINQGYSKCSILAVDENSLITSDKGIKNSLKNTGLNILLIREGNIFLEGMDFGFIGGSSGIIDDEILFFGDLSKHPDFYKIKEFIEDKGKKVVYFKDLELKDIGSIITLTA